MEFSDGGSSRSIAFQAIDARFRGGGKGDGTFQAPVLTAFYSSTTPALDDKMVGT